MNYAVILASGEGKRFGSRKQYSLLDGEELYLTVLNKVLESSVGVIALVINPDQIDIVREKVAKLVSEGTKHSGKGIIVVPGGAERVDSVNQGLLAIVDTYLGGSSNIQSGDKLIVVESARPRVTVSQIEELLASTNLEFPSVTYGIPIDNAILNKDTGDYVTREPLSSIQTPQAFILKTIDEAFRSYYSTPEIQYYAYEDCQVVMKELNIIPKVIPGSYNLLKITHLNDMESMKNLRKSKTVLVTGGTGSLGAGLVDYFEANNYVVLAPTRKDVDFSLPLDEFARDMMSYLEANGNPVIDILINNAGIMVMEDFASKEFFTNYHNMMNINLNNPLALTHMILDRNDKAVIINIASTSGELGRPKFMGYGISKGGMIIMTESLVAEGYTAFCINPGRLKSKLRSNYFGEEDIRNLLEPHHVVRVVENIINNHYPNGTTLSVRVDDGVFKVKDVTRG